MAGDILTTQDRETIIEWTQQRSAHAALVAGKHPEAPDDFEPEIGAPRIGFPGYAGEEVLEPIGWDEWFEQFEAHGLTFGYQLTGQDGTPSNYYELRS